MGFSHAYGTPEDPHQNELLVGKALKDHRDKVVIATKFGIHFDMESMAVNKPLVPDSRPKVIRAPVEASLKRLDTDHIDPNIPIEEIARVMAVKNQEGGKWIERLDYKTYESFSYAEKSE